MARIAYRLRKPPGDGWLTLIEADDDAPAVRVRLAPIGPSATRTAREALSATGHPIEAFAADIGFDEFCRSLVRRSILDWEGIGDDDGEAAPLTAETLEAFLADQGMLALLQTEWIFPWLQREAEKNVSAPSRAGTGPAMTGAKDTAAAAPPAATSAPTSSTRRKPMKAKPAGK